MKSEYILTYSQNIEFKDPIKVNTDKLTKAINIMIERESTVFDTKDLNTVREISLINNGEQILFYYNNKNIGYLFLERTNLYLYHNKFGYITHITEIK